LFLIGLTGTNRPRNPESNPGFFQMYINHFQTFIISHFGKPRTTYGCLFVESNSIHGFNNFPCHLLYFKLGQYA